MPVETEPTKEEYKRVIQDLRAENDRLKNTILALTNQKPLWDSMLDHS